MNDLYICDYLCGKVTKIVDDNTVLVSLTTDFNKENNGGVNVNHKEGDKVYIKYNSFETNTAPVRRTPEVGDEVSAEFSPSSKITPQKLEDLDCFVTEKLSCVPPDQDDDLSSEDQTIK